MSSHNLTTHDQHPAESAMAANDTVTRSIWQRVLYPELSKKTTTVLSVGMAAVGLVMGTIGARSADTELARHQHAAYTARLDEGVRLDPATLLDLKQQPHAEFEQHHPETAVALASLVNRQIDVQQGGSGASVLVIAGDKPPDTDGPVFNEIGQAVADIGVDLTPPAQRRDGQQVMMATTSYPEGYIPPPDTAVTVALADQSHL